MTCCQGAEFTTTKSLVFHSVQDQSITAKKKSVAGKIDGKCPSRPHSLVRDSGPWDPPTAEFTPSFNKPNRWLKILSCRVYQWYSGKFKTELVSLMAWWNTCSMFIFGSPCDGEGGTLWGSETGVSLRPFHELCFFCSMCDRFTLLLLPYQHVGKPHTFQSSISICSSQRIYRRSFIKYFMFEILNHGGRWIFTSLLCYKNLQPNGPGCHINFP